MKTIFLSITRKNPITTNQDIVTNSGQRASN